MQYKSAQCADHISYGLFVNCMMLRVAPYNICPANINSLNQTC